MLGNLLPDVCDVKRATIITSNGEQSKSYTVVYSGIKCRYYKGPKRLDSGELSQQSELWKYKMILEKDKTVLITDLIELNNEDYIVEDVRILKIQNSHHVELIIKRL